MQHDEVYPRVCGGTLPTAPRRGQRVGLSPRVRGNPIDLRPAGAMLRSIPACAGEPLSIRCCPASSKVYPRVCGGTAAAASPHLAHQGLSPRVRGNR